MFWSYLLQYCRYFFYLRKCQPSSPSFEIIKKITCFLQFELIFKIWTEHISISLMYKPLRAIARLFFSVFKLSFFDGYFISFHNIPYLIINRLIFGTLFGCDSISLYFNVTVIAYWKYLSSLFQIYGCFFVFYLVRRLYTWFAAFKIYFAAFAIQQLEWIENKVFKPIWHLQRKETQNVHQSSHKFCIVTLWVHYTLFINIFRTNKVNCYC